VTAAPFGEITSAAKLGRLIGRLRGRRIGVVGDLMLDRYVWGAATRLSPEAAVPVVDFASETVCPGGAGNVAANLAALGAKVMLFGATGADETARDLRASLTRLGIAGGGLIEEPRRVTTEKTRIIARNQQVVRVDRERVAPLAPAMEASLIRRIKASLPKLDVLVISDYDKGVVTDALAERVLEACHARGVPTLVKPKTSRLFAYRGSTAIVCNKKEAGFFVTRQLSDEKSVEEAGRALLAHFGCAAVVITLGEAGISLFEEGSPKKFHVPATSFEVSYERVGLTAVDGARSGRQVFDVTGAGDTVLSVLALALGAGAELPEAMVLANIAAGVVVRKLGTACVTPPELLGAVRDRH
jgi:rfaE bifunctional protein kinase chain/domain